jgi:glutathione synthase/RimK-type ligase-like ATP-grasp enzyme
LAEIEQSGAPLFNDLQTVRWNLDKTYLRSLAERGVPIVPTAWRERLRRGELAALFDEAVSEEIVVKPVVGAGAIGAFRLERRALTPQRAAEVETYYAERTLMAQPFLTAITSEGEYSLFYFNGQFSHAIQKVPQPGDFRVQEEHGSQILAAAPDARLRTAADRAVAAIGDPPLYARADLVRANDSNDFWLIELELVEPSLYLRMNDESPQRFAKALDRRVNGNQSGF